MRRFATLWMLLAGVLSGLLIDASDNPFPAPSVVVYPLTGTAQTPSEAGGNIALLLSTKLSQLGGIEVKPATPGTQRAQFLSAAVALGVDYYITGFLTPVGSDVSMIVQVVSVQSGSVLYSNTSTVKTYSDVLSQADNVRAAMLSHAGRGLPNVQQVSASSTAAPTVSHGAVNLTRALGRHRETAAPPLPWGLIVDVDGDAPTDQKRLTQEAFALDLHPLGLQGQILPATSTEAMKNAGALCKANPASVALFLMRLANTGTAVNVSVSAIGCDGVALGTQTASSAVSAKGASPAIAAASASAATSFGATIRTLTGAKAGGS